MGDGQDESCPTFLVEECSRRYVLRDGGEILIRPLLYGDRHELAERFAALSLRSRQLRFFHAPDVLDAGELEYLTNLDYQDHYACAAFLVDGPTPLGIGVARYLREVDDPTAAEVAVTVVDEQQRRGVGTLLMRTLGEVAAQHGIRTFVSYVLWQNVGAIEPLVDEGARITPAEPGVARIEIDLPAPVDETAEPYLHQVLAAFAARVRALGNWRGELVAGSGRQRANHERLPPAR